MKRILAVMCLSIALTGCSLTAPGEKIDVPVEWPKPIKELTVDFQVVDVGGEPYVAMPFEDFNKGFRPWMNDMARYLRDQTSMICLYRTPLKEPKCVKEVKE